jgi:hypothetical protein
MTKKAEMENAPRFPAEMFRRMLAAAAARSKDGALENGDAKALVACVKEASPRDIAEQVRSVGTVDRDFDVRIAEAKAVVAKAQQEVDLLNAQRAWMRNFILDTMVATGRREVTLPGMTMFVSDGKERVEVDDADAVPDDLVKLVRQVDKRAVLDRVHASDGVVVPGVRVVVGDPYLTIRLK